MTVADPIERLRVLPLGAKPVIAIILFGRWVTLAVGVLGGIVVSVVAAPNMVVDIQRDGGTVRLQATAEASATPASVWAVLTDFEGQLRFIPGLTESRVVAHKTDGRVVVQKGSVTLLFLRFDFEVEYVTQEVPPRVLTSRVIRGSVKRMSSEYRLSLTPTGTRLDYAGDVELDGWVPPVIGPLLMRRELEIRIDAFLREIERRQREEEGP
jgi:carbon monoxide dehydrogenase subunit G